MTSAALPRPATSGPEGARPVVLTWALWTAGFLAFPLAGLAGAAAAGGVETPSPRCSVAP